VNLHGPMPLRCTSGENIRDRRAAQLLTAADGEPFAALGAEAPSSFQDARPARRRGLAAAE